MIITPQKLAVKYNPPRICLIYSCEKEAFFHDFPIAVEDLKLPSGKLYSKMKLTNPGYLDNIDPDQICTLIEMIKKNCQKASKVQKLRGIVTGYRNSDEIEAASHESSDKEGVFDFGQVENQFESSSSNRQIDLEL